jgi:hypothetical protein
LSVRQQKQFVRLVLQGAAPSGVCITLGVPLESVQLTCETDARFRGQITRLCEALTDNVRAAIYRTALKGNVSAQTLWLKDEAQRAQSTVTQPRTPEEMLAEVERLTRAIQGAAK